MIWINPIAALGLLALAAPILIHILARQKAPRLPFPTLRFIQPSQLAAIRRRVLDDGALLAVRALVLAAAVGAVAGPFLVTAARHRAWDARTIRAEVTGDVREGLTRAIAWLDSQPPGRREIVVRSPLSAGSIGTADIAAVPAHVGLRFERTGTLPETRTLGATPVIAGGALVDREMTLDRDRTSVRDRPAGRPAALPIDILVAPDQRATADALLKTLAAERVPAPLASRAARVVFGMSTDAGAIRVPWMADAAGRIARDAAPLDGIRFGADGSRLLVITPAKVSDPSALSLLRSVLNALAPPAEHPREEILPIADAQLRAWARDPGPAAPPRAGTIDRDDRRWLWGFVLILLVVETRLRRNREIVETPTRAEAPAAMPSEGL